MEKRSTRSHWKIVGDHLEPKKTYQSEHDALQVASFLNTQPNIIH